MFKRLTGRASPPAKSPLSSKSGIKSISQPLILCSAALPNLATAKPAPEPCSTQGELLPPEILISILNGFATSVLLDKDRLELLKSKCLEGAKLGHNDDSSVERRGSILKSSYAILTYLTWGIRHLERASASLQRGETESKEEHLRNAEQMLKSLIDSMQPELNDHPTTILSSARVPNACFILALAHVFLALVYKLRTKSSNLVALHLLEAFNVSPNITRQSFVPELWNQLFHPHLSAVEAWHRKEHLRIIGSFSSTSESSKPCSHKTGDNLAVPIPANSVVPRANSLMDLVSGMRLSKRGTSSPNSKSEIRQSDHEQNKLLEKMSMQVKLLSDLYEQSLDEGTIQYARHYKDLVVSYSERFSYNQRSIKDEALQSNSNSCQLQIQMADYQVDKQGVTSTMHEAAAPNVSLQVDDEAVDGEPVSGGGWMGANALQLRRSLLDAIFGGTVPMHKTSKKDQNYSSSPPSQVSSLLHLCNKELPKIIDPVKQKVETDACDPAAPLSAESPCTAGKQPTIRDVVTTAFFPEENTRTNSNIEKEFYNQMETNACNPAATQEQSAGSPCTAGKRTTIRDVVRTAIFPEQDKINTSNTRRVAARGHSLSAETFFEGNLVTHGERSSSLMINDGSNEKVEKETELHPAFSKNNNANIPINQDTAATTGTRTKRLIDFIQDKEHRSDKKCSLVSSHEAQETRNRLSNSYHKRMSAPAASMVGTTVKEPRTIKRRHSESSGKNHILEEKVLVHEGMKKEMTAELRSSRKSASCTSETALVKLGASKPNMAQNQRREEEQVKHCTSVHVQQTRSLNTNTFKKVFNERANIEDARHSASSLEADVQKGVCATARKSTCTQLDKLANELRAVVQETQSNNNAPEGVGRCEEVLLRLSQAWLECKSATLLQQKEVTNKETESVINKGSILDILSELSHELLFILANSDLQEAQRLALCLLSASISYRKSQSNELAPLSQYDYDAERRGECNKSNTKQLPSEPDIWHALSHLLQQGHLPEATLLLHLVHPAQYSAYCRHFLPHLLPLLLDLAQHNTMPTTQNTFNHIASTYSSPFNGRHHLIGESLKPRALALMMMSRLLAAVDQATRFQACKHVLFQHVNVLPCLLHSLNCAPSVDEKIAAAFILTTCMQADESCRQYIVNHVKPPFVVALLQQSATNTSAFQTAVNFVSELLHTRKANIPDLLSSVRQDGLLNCMHALMAYLQTASLENQPRAAGLLLQLDLLLGDENRYSVFREEALEALLSPLLKESNEEAIFNAVNVLSTIGQNHSQQELEAWLLKRAGLGATSQQGKLNTRSTVKQRVPTSKKPEQEEEEEATKVAEWDAKVASALIEQGGGGLVSNALAKGLQSSMAEVRKACLLVAAWLSSHMRLFHQEHSADVQKCRIRRDHSKASAKKLMRQALQPRLQEIAAVSSGCSIVERVFAALALQNLAK